MHIPKSPAVAVGGADVGAVTAVITNNSALGTGTVVGQAYSVAVSVTSAGGTPTGSVTVSDGTATCPITVSGGTGSCSLTSTTAGTKTITATYAGTTNFAGSSGTASHVVNKASTTTTITNSSALGTATVVGQAYPVTWSVTVTSPGAGSPTGTVTVSDGSGATCSAAVATGTCNLTSTTAGTKTITASYPGDSNFGSSTSGGVSHRVNQAATHLAFGQQPTNTSAGAAISPAVTVRILDATNTLVATDNTTTVTLVIGTNAGVGTLSGTLTQTAVNGVATFSNLSLNKVGVGYTLVASSIPVLTGVTSSGFNITPGPAVTLVVSGFPSPVTAGAQNNVQVTAHDAFGNTATGYRGTVQITSSDPQADLPSNYTFTAGNNGTHTFSVTLESSGPQSIIATDTANTLIGGSEIGIQVTPAGLNHLAITPTSSTISAGASQAYLVTGYDGYGNVIGVEPATLTISPNGSCTGTTCTATVAGSHTVTATYSGKSVKATLTVTAAAPRLLVFGQQPTNTHRNSAITPAVTVQILDAYGNLVTTSTASVTISLATNPGGSTLSGTTTKSASGGIATFSNLSLNNAGTGYRLGAASSALLGTTSNTFNITN